MDGAGKGGNRQPLREHVMENRVTIGKLIGYLRTEADVSQEELCRGICSRAFLTRLEKGERDCEKIVSEALMQRLGVAADRLDYIAGPEEQRWILLREALYRSIEDGDEEGAAAAFAEYESYAAGKSPLHRQLLLYYHAVSDRKPGADETKLCGLLSEAWEVSRAGIPLIEAGKIRMTQMEICIAMMQARIMEDAERERAREIYEALLRHREKFADSRDVVRLYPQIAYRLAGLYLREENIGRALALAEKSLAFLKREAKLNYLRGFLEIKLQYGTCSEEEKKHLKEACTRIQWLYKEFGVEEYKWNWEGAFPVTKYDLCGEVLRARREVLGMSQEKLAEGVCDPVTVSRIECGKVSPKRGIYEKLMEKVGLSGSHFEASFPMENPADWKLMMEINRLLNQARAVEAEPLIEELERRLSRGTPCDRQILIQLKTSMLGLQGKITNEERLKMYQEALYITLPRVEAQKLKQWYFTKREIGIIGLLAQLESKMGEGGKYIPFLKELKNRFEGKFLSLDHYASEYEFICGILGDIEGNDKHYEEGIQMGMAGMRISLKNGMEFILSNALFDCGWNMEHLWETGLYKKETSLQYMKACFYLHVIYGQERKKNAVQKHIKEKYDLTLNQ